ncbi:DEAD/DEAH box helicase [Enterococcus caccae]|uniref:DEAD-box ATP dependent DNA helicase n=1 Tax=Enterococcus caccae ATCC BAA-1240 TaxID=1158612 RepID=R3WJ87_9ENTE|nr:DEAD/DEAH box helicase [Enterococcus caccae]EOL47472.1 DEAD-box ATP dependent DNA helicase [Enterococcus caccae ATCC BAA-1240]EOT65679.1 DEAD-box ATP dependent DNA helicase [Enterococcus caccae ATCC BAA-1240]OJG23770.1 DEAD-box ATP dependent DNA helicase [Enterococcus caccae]
MTFIKHLPEAWQEHWQASGFSEPSVIQEKSFQLLREKQNVLGISPTGSGKTLAYVLPLLLNVEKDQGSQLLILAPSQELAVQISQVVRDWATLLQLKTQSLIGGANVGRQIEKLKKKPEILVGTPGRVLELIKTKKIKSHLLKTVVMDEVDQLFHEKELNLTKQILASAPTEFQLVFYSATADRVAEEAEKLTNQLTTIDVTDEDQSSGVVKHYFMALSPRKKSDFLRSLAYTPDFRAMVFFNQVADLGSVEEKLMYEGVKVVGLASDQNKTLRKLAIDQFSKKQAVMLLTTDIAARGLDFDAIPFVVNADVPLSEESYIHRSGRVGRMGAAGSVITFVNDATKRDYQRLMKKIELPSQEIFLYDGAIHLTRKEKSLSDEKNTSSNGITRKEQEIKERPNKAATKPKKRPKNNKNKGARRKPSKTE